MVNNILFILEGEKEKTIVKNLTKFFINENTVVTCVYCTTIYKMYSDIKNDEYLDTFHLLKEIAKNKETLKDFKRSDFSQIFMFFDYDGHASNASDKKLAELLSFFNEETDKGKLYISYPMVEALKHFENIESFKELKSNLKDFEKYKQTVNSNCLKCLIDFNLYDESVWKFVIEIHLQKMNKIVHQKYQFPIALIDQITIFNKQLEKHIIPNQNVEILSAFPVFLHDYYGNHGIEQRIKHI